VTLAETLLNELITWKEMDDKERSEDREILELRRRLASSEEALRFKGTAYNVAVFERDQLWSAQAEKERAVEPLTIELDAEKKARREVERSRAGDQADIKSLHRRLDIAKKDAADAESRLGIAMDSLHKLMKEKDEWKRTQLQLTTDAVEGQRDDNRRLWAAEGQRNAEIQRLSAAKDKAEHALVALQAELATLKIECQVTISAVTKYKCKCSLANVHTENQRLVWELEKGQSLAHAVGEDRQVEQVHSSHLTSRKERNVIL
jgi:chromosome segregation ATPase